jgi:CRISPR-associated endonuclease/helicase Cas3
MYCLIIRGSGEFPSFDLMYPAHRKRVIHEIKDRLAKDLPCRVVSTSLIEAGVDIDFPTVYRSMAGLDSQIQAAGRCNREGKRDRDSSIVYIFTPSDEYKRHQPSAIKLPTEVAKSIARNFSDVASPEAIKEFFLQLYGFKGEGLDSRGIVKRMEKGAENGFNFPFAEVAEEFKLIVDATRSILIPIEDDDVKRMVQRLRAGERDKRLLRAIQPYIVNVYQRDYEALSGVGLLEPLDSEIALLSDTEKYSEKTGLFVAVESGSAIFG